MATAIHVTHEATQKIGGIGAVLEGILTTQNYNRLFPRTLLYTPLFNHEGGLENRLGDNAEVLYSGVDHYDGTGLGTKLAPLETEYGIRIVYGKKKLKSSTHDIVAVDIWEMHSGKIDEFKYKLWEHFGIQSNRYVHDMDFEQYVRIGAVLRDVFEQLYGQDERAILFSHEYMGVPSALSFVMDKRKNSDKTIFYAHEISTCRNVVENHPGHDLSFYNLMRLNHDHNISLEQEFGSFSHFSRNELVKAATNLDLIFAVSDVVKDEYLYLCPNADPDKIKVVTNGVSVENATFSEKERAISLIGQYGKEFMGARPDYIFTHVTRLIVSKGLWRDVRVLYYLNEQLASKNRTGFYILLATLIGAGRPESDIQRMEEEYGWPMLHREGWPDLIGLENDIYRSLEIFNAKSTSIKAVFINQFDFSRSRCGSRVPLDTSLRDLRLASDVEFGLSIYEPFGISQLETVPYGGLPLISSICGCYSTLNQNLKPSDYLMINFTEVPQQYRNVLSKKEDFTKISKELRDVVETEVCHASTPAIMNALPADNRERRERFKKLQKTSHQLDWEHVAQKISSILPLD